jgi:hypothetical protein
MFQAFGWTQASLRQPAFWYEFTDMNLHICSNKNLNIFSPLLLTGETSKA